MTIAATESLGAAAPFGEERADLRNAILCALVANVFRSKGVLGT